MSNFKVLQTPHFEIYYYLKNERLHRKVRPGCRDLVQNAPGGIQGYLSKKRTRLFFTITHPDFQQTTALQGWLSA